MILYLLKIFEKSSRARNRVNEKKFKLENQSIKADIVFNTTTVAA